MLLAKFLRFRRKRLGKQTHIDNFVYFFIFEKKSVNFWKKKIKKKFWKKILQIFYFWKKVGYFSKNKIKKNFENNFYKFFIFEEKVG